MIHLGDGGARSNDMALRMKRSTSADGSMHNKALWQREKKPRRVKDKMGASKGDGKDAWEQSVGGCK